MENKEKKVEEKNEEIIQTVKVDNTVASPKNNMAIAGFVCSLCGLITCGIVSIVGLILSIVGLKKSGEMNGEGKGLAIAGVVIGAIETVLMIITIIFLIIVVASASTYENIFSDNTNKMQDVYDSIGCSSYYCNVGYDGSYLEIDTNPGDLDDYSSTIAWEMIKDANDEFDFSDSLDSKMNTTRSLDGTVREENDEVEVSWTYHPDQGLEVRYTLK